MKIWWHKYTILKFKVVKKQKYYNWFRFILVRESWLKRCVISLSVDKKENQCFEVIYIYIYILIFYKILINKIIMIFIKNKLLTSTEYFENCYFIF